MAWFRGSDPELPAVAQRLQLAAVRALNDAAASAQQAEVARARARAARAAALYGQTLYGLGRIDEAAAVHAAALKASPELEMSVSGIGVCRHQQRRFPEAAGA